MVTNTTPVPENRAAFRRVARFVTPAVHAAQRVRVTNAHDRSRTDGTSADFP
jgi:hypothetical protein